ncbi:MULTISPECIES: sulfite exporter TauE/SafE family protein [Marinovum]|uniref:sulfite exporter TauE/SafE family protein n=1 Tax=Marinovum TaxID=367771 RepID=UPI00237BAF7C|nr:sulfite exporter TauE/SafE family protein [Marinovum sp. PR37]MDD9746441.1 sulfite exporter TauE/SafE family protein [Marinovum sp. PR37]
MDPALLSLLSLAVFGAAMLQAATGIGYGVIAGPIFLVVLNGTEAIQISTLHNLAIALVLVPRLRGGVQKPVLGWLTVGSIAGIAVGLGLQGAVSVVALKLVAAAMVTFVAFTLAADMRRVRGQAPASPPAVPEIISVGTLAGIMGGMLAMPGPLAATWMSVRAFDKASVRATILAFFVFAYGANVLSYALVSGFALPTLKLAAWLAPALALGVAAGAGVSARLSEALFRKVLLGVLTATVAMLLLSLW